MNAKTRHRPKLAHLATPLGVALALGLGSWMLRDRIETVVELPFGFRVKTFAKTDAVIPPNIKIVGFDDQFAGKYQRTELTLAEWAGLLRGIADQGVKAIYVDKRFSFAGDRDAAAAFVKEVKALPAKVAAAGWTRPYSLATEQMLDKNSGFTLPLTPDGANALQRRFGLERQYLYGPNAKLSGAFAAVGHIDYPGDGRMDAFVLTSTGDFVPSLALSLADIAIAPDGTVRANGRNLPINERGKIILDFPSYERLLDQTLSVAPMVDLVAKGKPLPVFEPGDVVLLVPSFFTGSGDMVSTPRGIIPGGYVWATALANLATDRFMTRSPANGLVYVLVPLLVVILASLLPGSLVLFSVGGMGVVLTASALSAFAYANVLVPWVAPLASGAIAAVFTIGLRHQRAEREIATIRRGLEGVVPATHLEKLTQSPEVAQVDVVGKVVSVMFVDVVGFSKFAASRSPREAYDMIKELLSEIIGLVHSHGGCVDRVLGDGLLCYFGHDHTTQAYDGNHAQQAVGCAIDIQRRFLVAGNEMAQKLPLRIGINTCPVVFGDLGSASRRDATLIGDGVNFAKRLESACDLYRVCISAATRSMLVATPGVYELRRRLIPVKHVAEAVEAFEIEPNVERVAARRDAVRRYYEFLGLSRSDERFQSALAEVELSLNGERVPLRNVSAKGLAVELVDYWAHGVALHFELKAKSDAVQAELERYGLTAIIGEVRWAEPVTDTMFLHGILIKNLSERQRVALHAILVGNHRRVELRQAG